MNPRILKKLTKKSDPIIVALGLTKNLERVISGPDGNIDSYARIDKKHRWHYRGGRRGNHYDQLGGTVGYGCMSGYYEPEWDESCCWSILTKYIFNSFTDWDSYGGDDNGPVNNCPRKLKRSTPAILQYARELADKVRQGGAK